MPANVNPRAVPPLRLCINVDHVATLRQARRTDEPDPVAAARVCMDAGAHGITAHLREDRRHIQDDDVRRLRAEIDAPLNLEMACIDEMLRIAIDLRPHQVTLVPERREEITTEGGLDLARDPAALAAGCRRLAEAGLRTSLFIDPDPDAIERAATLGVAAIELHTGRYAHDSRPAAAPLGALRAAAVAARRAGLAVHAGHGLTVRNVGPVAAIPEIEELNIGHSIVSMSVFTGIGDAVRAMLDAMRAARRSSG